MSYLALLTTQIITNCVNVIFSLQCSFIFHKHLFYNGDAMVQKRKGPRLSWKVGDKKIKSFELRLQLHGLKHLWASAWGGSLPAASSKSQQGHCSWLHPGCGPSAGPFTLLKLCEAWWPWGWRGPLVIQTAVMWSDWLSATADPPDLIPKAIKVLHLKVT